MINPIYRLIKQEPSKKPELTPAGARPYPIGVRPQARRAKIRDSYTHIRRQHRPHKHAGGFFVSVFFAIGGILPGSRGLQHGINRNNRVAFRIGDMRTRQLLPTNRTKYGATPMHAISAAYPCPFPAGPSSSAPKSKSKTSTPNPRGLVVQATASGYICTIDKQPVAWIVPGYHKGQQNNTPKTVRFVDVSYHRRTDHGINLETADFDTLQEAFAFVRDLFDAEGVNHG